MAFPQFRGIGQGFEGDAAAMWDKALADAGRIPRRAAAAKNETRRPASAFRGIGRGFEGDAAAMWDRAFRAARAA